MTARAERRMMERSMSKNFPIPIVFPITIEHRDPDTNEVVGRCKIPEPIDGNLVVLLSGKIAEKMIDLSAQFIIPLMDGGHIKKINYITEDHMTEEQRKLIQ